MDSVTCGFTNNRIKKHHSTWSVCLNEVGWTVLIRFKNCLKDFIRYGMLSRVSHKLVVTYLLEKAEYWCISLQEIRVLLLGDGTSKDFNLFKLLHLIVFWDKEF